MTHTTDMSLNVIHSRIFGSGIVWNNKTIKLTGIGQLFCMYNDRKFIARQINKSNGYAWARECFEKWDEIRERERDDIKIYENYGYYKCVYALRKPERNRQEKNTHRTHNKQQLFLAKQENKQLLRSLSQCQNVDYSCYHYLDANKDRNCRRKRNCFMLISTTMLFAILSHSVFTALRSLVFSLFLYGLEELLLLNALFASKLLLHAKVCMYRSNLPKRQRSVRRVFTRK